MNESKRLHSIAQILCALLLIPGLFSCNQHVESEDKQSAVEEVNSSWLRVYGKKNNYTTAPLCSSMGFVLSRIEKC